MIRQFAIASAGRAASTSLFETLLATLQVTTSVFPIWDFSPAARLAEAYGGDRYDHVLVKSETFHVIDLLRFPERTTLILLTRRDHLRQILSHLAALRAGSFHAGPATAAPPAFRIERHEFLALAHMVLAMEIHFRSADFSRFDRVERWAFEDLVADFPGHLRRLNLGQARISARRSVPAREDAILNMPEVLDWARDLMRDGLRSALLSR